MQIKAEFALMGKQEDGKYRQISNKQLPDISCLGLNLMVAGEQIELGWSDQSLNFDSDGTVTFCTQEAYLERPENRVDVDFAKASYIQCFCVECGEGTVAGVVFEQTPGYQIRLALNRLAFSDDGEDWVAVSEEVLENFNIGHMPYEAVQVIARSVKDYLDFCAKSSLIYAYGTPVDQITEQQYRIIAEYATWGDTESIHDAAEEVLGINPALVPASRKNLSTDDLLRIQRLAEEFYKGADEYQIALEDPHLFIFPVEKILKIILGESGAEFVRVKEAVRRYFDDEAFLQTLYGSYPYAVKPKDITGHQMEQIAMIAGSNNIVKLHEAARRVLGSDPAHAPEKEENVPNKAKTQKKYKIVLTCHDYRKPEPYTEELAFRYNTPEQAQLSVMRLALDELESLNGIDEAGNFPERRFIATVEDENHDLVINAWDGPDYQPVTCYDIVEVAEPVEG